MRIRTRRLRRSKGTLYAAFFLIVLFPLAAQDLSELSLSYIEQGRDAAASGDATEAARYLETAVALSPELGDAKVALAEFRAQQGEVAEALTLLESALGQDRFRRTAEDTARLALAELLVRTRRHREALDILGEVAVPRPRALYLRGVAALALDRRAAARDAADRGRALYPEDRRFVELAFRVDPASTLRFERWLQEHRSSDPEYLSLFGHFLRTVEPPASFLPELREYLDLGGSDPAVVARYLGDLDDGVERFLALGGALDKYALELAEVSLDAAGREGLSEAVRRRLREFAGDGEPVALAYDGDRDGYREGSFYWERGAVRRWEVDEDQNGVIEVTVLFDPSGVPSEASYDRGVRLTFDRYPYIATVELRDEDELRTLYLREERLAQEAVDPTVSWYAERNDLFHTFALGEPPPDREILLRYTALEVTEREQGGVTYRRLFAGAPLLEYRDRNGDGTIEEMRLFEEGSMTHGLIDPDGDGSFEIYERFGEDGVVLQGIDEDATGRSEIFLPFIQGIARWDSDEDRRTDFGLVTDQISRFIDIEGRMRNNLESQLELFGNGISP